MSKKCKIVTIVEGSDEFEGDSPEETWSSSKRENFYKRLDQLFAEETDYCWVDASLEPIPSKLKASSIGIGFFSPTEYVDEALNLEFSEINEDLDELREEYEDLEDDFLYHLVDLDAYVHQDVIYQSAGRLKIYYFLRFVN